MIKHIYTDGSVKSRNIGIGVWSSAYSLKISNKLHGLPDSNRAELGAIFISLAQHNIDRDAIICTDSQVSLNLIHNKVKKKNPKYSILVDCIQYLHEKKEITFKKVKAHSGIPGNEKADKLAKKGSDNNSELFILPDDLYTCNTQVSIEDIIRKVFLKNCL